MVNCLRWLLDARRAGWCRLFLLPRPYRISRASDRGSNKSLNLDFLLAAIWSIALAPGMSASASPFFFRVLSFIFSVSQSLTLCFSSIFIFQ